MDSVLKRHIVWDTAFLTVVYLIIVFTMKPQTPAVFLLLILSLNLVVTRFRFPRLRKHSALDMLLFLVLSFWFTQAHFLLIPPFYLAIRDDKRLDGLFIIPLAIIGRNHDPVFLTLLVLSILFGLAFQHFQREKRKHLTTIDALRKSMLGIQKDHASLLNSQSEISRIAAYSERDRIAQTLHDNLGHEITAGLLSLKAYETLKKKGQGDQEVLTAGIQRLENAADELKRTVHNTKPLAAYGLEIFEQEIKRFPTAVDYDKSGDLASLKAHHWQVLNAVIKESFTNILKHSQADRVDVSLEVTPQIVRLSIKNNHPNLKKRSQEGYGLRFMRQRIEALGGSLTLQHGVTFEIIAIIPIEEVGP